MSGLPLPVACTAALASLPEVGPARLRALLARGPAHEVLTQLAAGALRADPELAAACGRADPRPLIERWSAVAAGLDVRALWRAHVDAGVSILVPGSPHWPAALLDDPDPPAVLFARGQLDLLAVPGGAVAVVGTRRCTRYGWEVAHDLGGRCTAAGAKVVSGLAAGIDAAAHRGTLDAVGRSGAAPRFRRPGRPVGVVATGLDVPYPRANAGLWEEVAAAGVLVSEAALGTPPARWRFPARNRVIAALADVVVVVESAAAGGAMHTVDEALARERGVFAVPGPITSPASLGTNRLLRDVAVPVCEPADVLWALGVASPGAGRDDVDTDDAAPAHPHDAALLEALGWTPASLEELSALTSLALGEAAAALARLEAGGFVQPDGNRWLRARRREGMAR